MQATVGELARRARYTALRVEGRVLHVTLSRPEVLNALHPPAHFELAEVFDAFADDANLWIAVIRGAGERSFCTGTDLKVRAQLGQDEYPPSGFAGLTRRFDLDKPVVAAVNGLALGGGLEIALALRSDYCRRAREVRLPRTEGGFGSNGRRRAPPGSAAARQGSDGIAAYRAAVQRGRRR